MTFKVYTLETAESDIAEAVAYIQSDSPTFAGKWARELVLAIESLGEFPLRYPVVQEAEELGRPYRSFVHYSHRVVYDVDEASCSVDVVRVYHSALPPLSIENLN